MHPSRSSILLLALIAVTASGRAANAPPLDEHLEAFRPFLNKTWRGEFKNSNSNRPPMMDVARWERALNGQAIRVLHSVNDGIYGGESILRWDKDANRIVYHYFTTAGFMTTGSIAVSDGKFVSLEKVTGDAHGVTEVRTTTEFKTDGSFVTTSEYLREGQPAGGREVHYREDPEAEVKFK